MTPDKVTIEITGEGYSIRVMAGDEVLAFQRNLMLSEQVSVVSPDALAPPDTHIEGLATDYPTLVEEIFDLLGFPTFEVAVELSRLRRGTSVDQA